MKWIKPALFILLPAILVVSAGCMEKEEAPPAPPTAGFKADVTYGAPPLAVQFEDASVPGAGIDSWNWAFGDGTTSMERDPSHSYSVAGVYTVILTVSGPGGADDCAKLGFIIATNPANVIDFTGNPTSGFAPLAVQFTDLSTVSGSILSWSWDFGDGNGSSEQDPSHSFSTPGAYTVSLTVTIASGSVNKTKQAYITALTQTTPPGGGGTTPPAAGVDPSNGSGGTIAAGQSGFTTLGAEIYIPTSYAPSSLASPVIWLFNEQLSDWSAIADGDKIVICDLHEYNNTTNIVNKLNETITLLESQYNVDKARYYWAGWSAGGNLAVIIGSQNQSLIAGTMVFPGTGGNLAQPHLQSWTGHKIRLYYACGDQDPNYSWTAVKYESDSWNQWYGYTTRFDKVAGSGHYISESTYQIRSTAWNWIKGYNLQN